MSALRLPARLYIAVVALAAGSSALIAFTHTSVPDVRGGLLAVALAACMTIAYLFPLHFSLKTKLYLDTSVIFAAVLLFEPGIAMLIVGAGTLLANTIRHDDWDQGVFNASQTMFQAAVGGVILAVAGWGVDAPRFSDPALIPAIVAAAAAMYLVNTLAVAGIVGLQSNLRPLRVWRDLTIDDEPMEWITHLSQLGIGVLAAVIAESHFWALALLLLPAVGVYSSFARHVELRPEGDEQRSDFDTTLTAGHAEANDACQLAGGTERSGELTMVTSVSQPPS